MYNLAAYRPLLLIETLIALHKWHKIIGKQPYEQWREQVFDTQHTTASHTYASNDIEQANIIRKHIDAIVRNYPIEFNCMRRCMALKSMLAKRTIHSQMHIGVKLDKQKGSGKLDAHSWITVNDVLINDSQERISEYTEITNQNALLTQALGKLS